MSVSANCTEERVGEVEVLQDNSALVIDVGVIQ